MTLIDRLWQYSAVWIKIFVNSGKSEIKIQRVSHHFCYLGQNKWKINFKSNYYISLTSQTKVYLKWRTSNWLSQEWNSIIELVKFIELIVNEYVKNSLSSDHWIFEIFFIYYFHLKMLEITQMSNMLKSYFTIVRWGLLAKKWKLSKTSKKAEIWIFLFII